MDRIPTTPAKIIPNPEEIKDSYGVIRCAQTPDGRQFALRSRHWPRGCYAFPIRMATELIYFAVAGGNALPMPAGVILVIDGEKCWGSEFRRERKALSANCTDLTADRRDFVMRSLQGSPDQLAAYLRATFLDLLLLNNDRTEWNVLSTESDGLLKLSYFDHDRSLGWRGDLHKLENNRVFAPAEEYANAKAYLGLERKYHWGQKLSSAGQRRDIFSAFKVDPDLLDELRPQIPKEWLDDQRFKEMKDGLSAWWAFLRALSYEELDRHIFCSGVADGDCASLESAVGEGLKPAS